MCPFHDKPKIRVLIADDSALMRRTLRRVLEDDSDFEVIDTARDGEDAVAKARELRPDVVSMDINMPKLDGISALQLIISEGICPVVMLSSLTQHGAVATFESLELGAFDFVAKPGGTVSAELGSVARDLRAKLKAAASSRSLDRAGRRTRAERVRRVTREARELPPGPKLALPERAAPSDMKVVAIGISTGGPATIMEVLPAIPHDVNAAFFLVQHMPGSFTGPFARRLDETCQLHVEEAAAGVEVRPGCCYVARGEYQMTVHRAANGRALLRTPTKPDTLFKPSVDVMMESVLAAYGASTIGVLMTGIGDDGANAMVKIKQAGGYTIAESEETAVVYGMPREAIERGGANVVLASWDVAKAILRRL